MRSAVQDVLESGFGEDDPRRRDVGVMRRVRTVNGCFLSLMAAAPSTILVYASLGAWKACAAVAISSTVGALALVAMRRGFSIEVATHVNLTSVTLLLGFLGSQLGGMNAPGEAWVFVPGVLAGLVLGARAAVGYVTVGAGTILGYYLLHLAGVTFASVLPPDFVPFYNTSMTILLGGVLAAVVTVFLRAQHDMESALRAVNQDLEVSRDAAKAAAAVKSDFLATMSHEIRTPMNGIFGMIELALDTAEEAEQRDFLGRARACAERLMSIVNDVLDFSKIEAGKLDLESVDFEVRAVVEAILDTLAIEAARKKLEIVGVVDDALPPRLRGDPGRLQQIIMNLAANALKFTDHGEIVISLERAPGASAAPGAEVPLRCTVRDTGIGIPPAQQERIFESFTQADSSTTRCYGGTGLGLTISQQLVALMGGTIGVTSALGRGSTFWFTVPLAPAEERPSADRRRDLTGLRVLVVDDNATNRMVLLKILQSWGCRAALASGGLEAVDVMVHAAHGGEPFGLVLLDVQMPDVDGYATTRRIRREPALRDVPIVALTSISRTVPAEARDLGFAALLPKPIKQALLLDAIVVATRATVLRPAHEEARDAAMVQQGLL